jgi:hypothetical protein
MAGEQNEQLSMAKLEGFYREAEMQRLKQEQPMSEEGCGYDSKMDALKAFF